MQRLLAIPLVLLTVSVAALGGFPGARVVLSHAASDVDHVTLYQGGLAAITMERTFEATGHRQELVFLLPTTAIFDSLSVKGDNVKVQQIRSSLATDPGLHPGDLIHVKLEGGQSINGTLMADEGGKLLVSGSQGLIVVEASHVLTVEVIGRALDPAGLGAAEVTLVIEASAGTHTVRLSYLAQGSGWTPNYILDPKTGDFTFFATLTGLQDWGNVTLDLVAGNPHTVYTPQWERDGINRMAFSAALSGAAMKEGYDTQVSESQLVGDLHRYHYSGTISFVRGETIRIPMVTGKIDVLRHYYEASTAAYAREWAGLPEKYELRNTLSEPLPTGTIRLFIDGEFVGADTLQTLGKGETTNVTAANSGDVKARIVAVGEERGSISTYGNGGSRRQEVKTTYDIQVRNLRTGPDARIDVRTTFSYSDEDALLSVKPQPDERLVHLHVWNDDAASGETLHYRLVVETHPYV